MSDITIEPLEGECVERSNGEPFQYGWLLSIDGCPSWHATTGGTGDCWNFSEVSPDPGFEPGDPIHVCDLDEFVAALTALRDSEAHKANVARWA